ncbi:MAG: methyl-accepting chemotaxis protein [Myxococcota bacterium]
MPVDAMPDPNEDPCGLVAYCKQLCERIGGLELEKQDLVRQLTQLQRDTEAKSAKVISQTSDWATQLEEGLTAVNRTSEEGVLTAGRCVTHIVSTVTDQTSFTQKMGDRLRNDDQVSSTVREQNEAIQAFSRTVKNRLEEQRDMAERALHESKEVTQAGERITAIANASHILALNAQIEASRSGEMGKCFGVIATEMSSLQKDIHKANAVVNELSESLSHTLPRFISLTSELEALVHQLSTDLVAHQEHVRKAEKRILGLVMQAVDMGKDRMGEILETSNEALSALQFQDPVMQRLWQLSEGARQLSDATERVLMGSASERDERAPEEAPIPLGNPLELEFEDAEAGELMLF